MKKKVYVGLSGGVDSAVSAALLKKEGYDVTGVFIKAWTPFDSAQGKPKYECMWRGDRRSAMRVAAVLDIPFITLDLEKEYKKEVVDYMIRDYKAGKTPNPDVMCNKEIKFGHFLKFALKNSADFVATGHYAQIISSPRLDFGLKEGKDKNKDQSYFLWTLTQNQLKHILFPVGYLQKEEVRKLAKKFSLPQATRKDSQGLCFLGQINMKEFLSQYIPQKRGDVLNEKGEIIGHHNGVLFFTIGERHGFTVIKKTDKDVPLYVISKNVENNTVTVAPKIEQSFPGEHFVIIKDVNWISGEPGLSKKYLCRVRYRQEKQKCMIEKDGKDLKIMFDKPQIISAGQSLIIYDTCPHDAAGKDEICLGGGIIS